MRSVRNRGVHNAQDRSMLKEAPSLIDPFISTVDGILAVARDVEGDGPMSVS
jgi:hypothetical protein